jgi:hypothetical protein
MPFIFKRLALFMSIAAAFAADKASFQAPEAAAMPRHQTTDGLTIGVDAYDSGPKVKLAFGKLSPGDYGILPVLVVMRNDGAKAIQLRNLRVEFVGPKGDRVVATPATEVRYAVGPDPLAGQRRVGPIPIKKKNPLDGWEIQGRAFTAQILPAGNAASGFFYFNAELQPGATLYVSGLAELGSGRQLVYFEIPLN